MSSAWSELNTTIPKQHIVTQCIRLELRFKKEFIPQVLRDQREIIAHLVHGIDSTNDVSDSALNGRVTWLECFRISGHPMRSNGIWTDYAKGTSVQWKAG